METQQEILRNEFGIIINTLGVTYNDYGQNLYNQLQLNYKKLHGQATETKAIGKRKGNSKVN